MPRLLLTGGTGQVGGELRRTLAPLADVWAPGRAELDLEDAGALRAAVARFRPAAVVNAAAYTAVDRAEERPDEARRLNAAAPGALAEAAAALGVPMLHFSTDYVFDGSARAPYRESDPTCPLGVYGASKREGEQAVLGAGGSPLIFRTSWVYGLRGANFLRTMLRLAREREELRVVNDQHGAPTWSRMIAEATALVLAQLRTSRGFELPQDRAGIYHLTAAGRTTWFEFAQSLLEQDPHRQQQRCTRLLPIATADYPTPARRPAFSVLCNDHVAAVWGIRLPHWQEQLALCLAEAESSAGPPGTRA